MAGVVFFALACGSVRSAPASSGDSDLAEEALRAPSLAGTDSEDGVVAQPAPGGKEMAPVEKNPFTVKSGLYAGIFGGGAFSNAEYGYSAYPAPVGFSGFT